MKCEKSGNHTISYRSLLLSTTVLNDECLNDLFDLCTYAKALKNNYSTGHIKHNIVM